jgi:hypothetical protein
MSQIFKLQNEKGWKTLLLTDDSLMLVNKSYDSVEEFTEKFHEKGLLKERLELSVLDISRIAYPEKKLTTASITYQAKERSKELALVFTGEAEQEAFVKAVSKPRNLTASTAQVSLFKAIGPSLLGLLLTALFTFAIYNDAQIIEMGGEVDTSGRKTLYKKLFAWLAEILGTKGAIIAGVAATAACLYFLYKNIKSRPVEVVYS